MFELEKLKDLNWTELDAVFTFCRRRLFEDPKYRCGPLRVLEVVNQVHDNVKEYSNIKDANYCEVGCGIYHPFGVAAIMYLNGARSITVIDKNPSDLHRAAEALYDLLMNCSVFSERWFWSEITPDEYRRRLLDFDLDALQKGNLIDGLKNINYEYVVRDILDVGHLENKIDILSSRATLEHFEYFERGVRVLYDLMSRGGIAFHHIDLRDHRAYHNAGYNFWSFLTEDGPFSDFNSNRLRAKEILLTFEQSGCEILAVDFNKMSLPDDVRRRLLPKYQKMTTDELETVSMVITLQKSNE